MVRYTRTNCPSEINPPANYFTKTEDARKTVSFPPSDHDRLPIVSIVSELGERRGCHVAYSRAIFLTCEAAFVMIVPPLRFASVHNRASVLHRTLKGIIATYRTIDIYAKITSAKVLSRPGKKGTAPGAADCDVLRM